MRNGTPVDPLGPLHWSVIMFGKSAFLVLILAANLTAPVKTFAQDAGVSGIPRGPGSAGGLNNSVNDPSGIGNAARISPPPQPNIAVPVVPSAAPMVSTRVSPAVTPRAKIYRRAATLSRSEFRRSSARAPARARSKPVDSKFSICRGC
jgi:hypothetical protein